MSRWQAEDAFSTFRCLVRNRSKYSVRRSSSTLTSPCVLCVCGMPTIRACVMTLSSTKSMPPRPSSPMAGLIEALRFAWCSWLVPLPLHFWLHTSRTPALHPTVELCRPTAITKCRVRVHQWFERTRRCAFGCCKCVQLWPRCHSLQVPGRLSECILSLQPRRSLSTITRPRQRDRWLH